MVIIILGSTIKNEKSFLFSQESSYDFLKSGYGIVNLHIGDNTDIEQGRRMDLERIPLTPFMLKPLPGFRDLGKGGFLCKKLVSNMT